MSDNVVSLVQPIPNTNVEDTDWFPTNELRWFMPNIGSPQVLQQKWITTHWATSQKSEWRNIPVVIGEDISTVN